MAARRKIGELLVEKGYIDESSLSEAVAAQKALETRLEAGQAIPNMKDRALFFRSTVFPAMEALRTPIDKLEMLVDAKLWPVPTYGEMIFEV